MKRIHTILAFLALAQLLMAGPVRGVCESLQCATSVVFPESNCCCETPMPSESESAQNKSCCGDDATRSSSSETKNNQSSESCECIHSADLDQPILPVTVAGELNSYQWNWIIIEDLYSLDVIAEKGSLGIPQHSPPRVLLFTHLDLCKIQV